MHATKQIVANSIIGSEKCYGNNLYNSRNCIYSFEFKNGDSCKYVNVADSPRDSFDVDVVGYPSLQYESLTCDFSPNTCFSLFCWKCDHVYYSANCHNSSYLFGCDGLRNKKYCIFNKQYTKEQYNNIVPTIIEHMQSTGERGEFFIPSLSPFCYNETVAHEYYPLTRDEALARGYTWQDNEYSINVPEGIITIYALDIPNSIDEVGDDILTKAIICEVSGKPFRIIKPELAFYRKHGIPLPRKHPDIRHQERLEQRPGRELYLRICDKTGEQILSVYPPDAPCKVYSEEAYRQEVFG